MLAEDHTFYLKNISAFLLNSRNTGSLVVCDIPLRKNRYRVKSIYSVVVYLFLKGSKIRYFYSYTQSYLLFIYLILRHLKSIDLE